MEAAPDDPHRQPIPCHRAHDADVLSVTLLAVGVLELDACGCHDHWSRPSELHFDDSAAAPSCALLLASHRRRARVELPALPVRALARVPAPPGDQALFGRLVARDAGRAMDGPMLLRMAHGQVRERVQPVSDSRIQGRVRRALGCTDAYGLRARPHSCDGVPGGAGGAGAADWGRQPCRGARWRTRACGACGACGLSVEEGRSRAAEEGH